MRKLNELSNHAFNISGLMASKFVQKVARNFQQKPSSVTRETIDRRKRVQEGNQDMKQ